MKALGIAERRGLPRFVSQQIHYTLQAREAEYELVPIAIDQGLGHAGLEPAGRRAAVAASTAATSRARRARGSWPAGTSRPSTTRTSCTTSSRCSWRSPTDRGVSAAQVALAWLLARPAVTSVIIGARTDEQLADNLAAADLSLTAEERARLDEVSRPPLLYPYWHQAKTAADRLGPADLSLLGPYLAG